MSNIIKFKGNDESPSALLRRILNEGDIVDVVVVVSTRNEITGAEVTRATWSPQTKPALSFAARILDWEINESIRCSQDDKTD